MLFAIAYSAVNQGAFEPPANLSVATLKGLWENVKDKKATYNSSLDARVSAFVGETFIHFDSDKTNTLRFDELKACFRLSALYFVYELVAE
jgi:hypothetical protein